MKVRFRVDERPSVVVTVATPDAIGGAQLNTTLCRALTAPRGGEPHQCYNYARYYFTDTHNHRYGFCGVHSPKAALQRRNALSAKQQAVVDKHRK